MARLTLTTPGEDVTVGGTVSVVGTRSGGEVLTLTGGQITLDASFNAGGDTIVLPGNSGAFTVRLSGSQAILASPAVSVSIPLGISGTSIQFGDTTLTLQIDASSGAAMLGEQIITSASQPVGGTAPQSPYGTTFFLEVESNDTLETANQVDGALLGSSLNDPNLTDPSAPSVELRGRIEDNNDVDVFAIELNAGDTITLDVDGAYVPDAVSGLDSVIGLFDSAGTLVAENDDGEAPDEGSSSEFDSYLTYQAPVSGTYYIAIGSFENGTAGGSPENYHLLVSVDGATAAQSLPAVKEFPEPALAETMSLPLMGFA